jgi:hypothetical protein
MATKAPTKLKSACLWFAFLFGLVGALIFCAAIQFVWKHGFDYNDVMSLTEDGGAVDWTTGERPFYAQLPACAYSLPFFLMCFASWFTSRRVGMGYHGRICRGTE